MNFVTSNLSERGDVQLNKQHEALNYFSGHTADDSLNYTKLLLGFLFQS